MHDPVRLLLGVGAVLFWLAASIPLAVLGLVAPLPGAVGVFLFFVPQYLFGFALVVRPVESGFARLFPEGTAVLACVALWLAVAIGHAVLTRRWTLTNAFLAALASVVGCAVIVHLAFAAFGYAVQLDGL
ncbi:hypothetical protein LYSCAS_26210 [Lysobacter caseinilyticus]|uniref:DUF4175 domain-containing protein n=1 Tax=Noviluteimonas caseinilytica TaxID=2675101 RepID=A0ABN6FV65_9GAMM|nr:hypothetical protein LYSCAS_26210 [Lysobacter caseinilyticus]